MSAVFTISYEWADGTVTRSQFTEPTEERARARVRADFLRQGAKVRTIALLRGKRFWDCFDGRDWDSERE